MDNDNKKNFSNWLSKKNIEFLKEDINEDWDDIENRIMAEIANKIWGKEYFYKQSLKKDSQVQEALKYFTQARELYSKE